MNMISRRRFILGALGLGVVSATGAWQFEQHPSLAYRLDLTNSPDRRVPDKNVQLFSGSFGSTAMRRDLAWTYSVPNITPVATVFCLHGKGGDHHKPFNELRLQDFVAALELPLAVAAVDGTDSYWHRRSDGTNSMAMLTDEFIPFIEHETGTKQRALYGWSMGGYGALLAAATHPGMFSAVTALSPALWTTSSDTAEGAFDDHADFEAHDVFERRSTLTQEKIHISCGADDPFYDATKTFVSGLPSANVDFGDGYHDASYWRSVTPAALQFIAAQNS